MRIRLYLFGLALCFLEPAMLRAQPTEPSMSPYNSGSGEDSIKPKSATIFGGSVQVARRMLVAMRLQRRERDLCWEVGCVVIVNESAKYELTAFNIDSSVRTGKPGWGNNQLATPLRAMKATYRIKFAETKTCALPVQFVLNHVESREQVTVEGHSDLCMSPQRVSMIRLKVVTPSVIIEPQEPISN